MKIESQIYTRYLTEQPSFGNHKGNVKEMQSNKSNAVSQSVQDSKLRTTQKASAKQITGDKHIAKNNSIPSALSDVITEEERTMLQQVFPEKGAKWGTAAYKTADFSLNNLSVGNKLDLMS